MFQEAMQLLPSIFPIIGAIFSILFMLMVLYIMIRAMWKNDVIDLFNDPYTKTMSSTKFWQNIAYAAATIAFLSINLTNKTPGEIEMIWMIYLAVVAGNAVVSKLISAKYNVMSQATPVMAQPEPEIKAPQKTKTLDNPDAP